MTENSGNSFTTVDEAKANWAKFTAKDKLDFYKYYDDNLQTGDYKDVDWDELDFYDSKTDKFNIDEGDVPTCENPLTHYAATDTEADTNVLMIHNDYDTSGKFGTAQKFSSSSTITIPAGTYAELSLWVKTADLRYGSRNGDDDKKGQIVTENRGAYIDITQTVGGTTLDSIQVKNINTEDEDQKTAENKEVLTGELESFSLDFDEKSSVNSKQNEDEEEDEIDRRFAEYQKFLRENLEMDDEEDGFGPEIEGQPHEFETTDFTDKSPDEIADMVKNLPPQMREILLSNALGRNDFDEENDQSNSTQNNSN